MKTLSMTDQLGLMSLLVLPTRESLEKIELFFLDRKFSKQEIQQSLLELEHTDKNVTFLKDILLAYQLPFQRMVSVHESELKDASLFLADRIEPKAREIVADILFTCNQYGITDKHQIAYILATAKGESDFVPRVETGSLKYKFEPRKGGKRSYNTLGGNIPCGDSLVHRGILGNSKEDLDRKKLYNSERWPSTDYEKSSGEFKAAVEKCDFNVFAGVGIVQLTGRKNMEKFNDVVGGQLVDRPELAQESHNAVKMLVLGMKEGRFKGSKLRKGGSWSDKRLETYGGPDGGFDANAARRIINGKQLFSHRRTVYGETFKKGTDEKRMFSYLETYYFNRMISPFK